MKQLLAFVVLLVAFSAFGANPDYKSFRGIGGIGITTNPPNGLIIIDGSGIAGPTNGVSLSMATNIAEFYSTNTTGRAALPLSSVQFDSNGVVQGSDRFTFENDTLTVKSVSSPIRLFADGDSITAASSLGGYTNSWFYYMYSSISNVSVVTNLASAGAFLSTISNRWQNVTNLMGTGITNNIFCVLIGINDRFNFSNAVSLSYKTNLNSYFSRLRGAGFKVAAGTILPYSADLNAAPYALSEMELGRKSINEWISVNTNVSWVFDFANVLYNPDGTNFISDGLHPSVIGEQLMGRTALAALSDPENSYRPRGLTEWGSVHDGTWTPGPSGTTLSWQGMIANNYGANLTTLDLRAVRATSDATSALYLDGTATRLVIGNVDKVTVAADAITISTNVGIGVTAPTEKLEVAGVGFFHGQRVSVPNITGVFIGTNTAANGGGGLIQSANFASNYKTLTLDADNILFNSSSSGGQERMRILGANGNVGIGTTNPVSSLDVTGQVRAASAIISNVLDVTQGSATAQIGTLKVMQSAGLNTSYVTNGLFVGPSLVGITNTLFGSASLDFPSTLAGTSSDLPITVTGVVSNNCHVSLCVPWEAASGGGIFTHFESNGVVYVRFSNNQLTLAIDPTPATFSALVFRVQ